MASNKRDQLLNTAENLFYREGYHATGIDRILAESGVAKMTLYKHFKSKDELILAVLDARHERRQAAAARGATGRFRWAARDDPWQRRLLRLPVHQRCGRIPGP